MEDQAQVERPSGFRAGIVVELVVIRYPHATANFATLFGPSPAEVIDAVCRLAGRAADDLVVQPIMTVVADDPAAQRVVSVELRVGVEIGRGPLIAVVNGMSARALRDGLQSLNRR